MRETRGLATCSMRLNAVSVARSTTSKRERAISAPPVKRKRERVMLNTQDKRDIIYALEEWTKALEGEGNIAWRNYVMELTWKVSAMDKKAYELEGESE
jgi:hypothetical protein